MSFSENRPALTGLGGGMGGARRLGSQGFRHKTSHNSTTPSRKAKTTPPYSPRLRSHVTPPMLVLSVGRPLSLPPKGEDKFGPTRTHTPTRHPCVAHQLVGLDVQVDVRQRGSRVLRGLPPAEGPWGWQLAAMRGGGGEGSMNASCAMLQASVCGRHVKWGRRSGEGGRGG